MKALQRVPERQGYIEALDVGLTEISESNLNRLLQWRSRRLRTVDMCDICCRVEKPKGMASISINHLADLGTHLPAVRRLSLVMSSSDTSASVIAVIDQARALNEHTFQDLCIVYVHFC